MAWQQLKINIKYHCAEELGDLLTELGAQAVTFLDAKNTPMYEPKPGEIMLWPDTQVVGLYDANEDLSWAIAQIGKVFPSLDMSAIVLNPLEDKDWEREWMVNFHPMKFGERLWICPSWCDVPDINAVNIMLDPGLAFGTGTHPTTSLCLAWLDSIDLHNKVVVDFGCGSGILGIAALKLGAKEVIGIDIDPQALQASEENAKRNNVNDRLSLFLPQDQPAVLADIVLANILAGPLKELFSTIANYCKKDGKLLMSGILEEQSASVMQVYENQFSFDPIAVKDEWVRLSGTKNK